MKTNMLIVSGIAGILIGLSAPDVKADLHLRLGDIRIDAGDRPRFVIDTRPSFIYLEDQGFSVSINSPYDIVFYDDMYYLYREGGWYRSSDYGGPWVVIEEYDLPHIIRRHRWEDLRRYRDIEYRRHDHSYWEERDRRERERYRDRDREKERERFIDNRPRVNPDQRSEDNRGSNRDQRNEGNRLFEGNNRGNDNRKAPDQPKAPNVIKAQDQPKKDDSKKGTGQPKKDGKDKNTNQPR